MLVLSTYIYPDIEAERLINFLHKVMDTLPTKNAAKKAIKMGAILVDGEAVESGRYISRGQKIEHIELKTPSDKIFKLAFEKVYEDEYLALINKPSGYSVSGNYFKTIQNAIPYNFKKSNAADALSIAQPVHRLDNQTSGLLLIAKTQSTRIELGKQFENNSIEKQYQAVVLGEINESGVLDKPIDGKPAKTRFSKIQTVGSLKYTCLSLVNLYPESGRTHQIRIHLSQTGHPVLGDKLYTPEELLFKGKGLFLASVGLTFFHPVLNKSFQFYLDTPHKFLSLLKREENRWNNLKL